MGIKKTTEQFIIDAIAIHGLDKYDYSKVVYVSAKTRVCIICPKHGEFWQTADNHHQGKGCPECAKELSSKKQSLTTKEFVKRSKLVHGNRYNYSKVKYVNCSTKVLIECKIHGYFMQTPSDHLSKCGCPKCGLNKLHDKFSLTKEEFVSKARLVHGDKYNYSKVEYFNSNIKVCITCPEHGDFWQAPKHHLDNHGCPECVGCKKLTNKTFISKAKIIHSNIYSYSKVNYKNARSMVIVTCPFHGNFEINAHSHLMGSGCPVCSASHGEVVTAKILDKNNIKVQIQKTFINCKNIKHLRFDFYLPEYNLAIEFDGEQHYKPVEFFGGEIGFKQTQYRDNIKTNYCYDNNIILCRIRYDENIYNVLSEYLDLKENING